MLNQLFLLCEPGTGDTPCKRGSFPEKPGVLTLAQSGFSEFLRDSTCCPCRLLDIQNRTCAAFARYLPVICSKDGLELARFRGCLHNILEIRSFKNWCAFFLFAGHLLKGGFEPTWFRRCPDNTLEIATFKNWCALFLICRSFAGHLLKGWP